MFYLIGLGLNEKSLSIEALEICKKADIIYLETYTATVPYDIKKIESLIEKNVIKLERDLVEKSDFLDKAKEKNVVLLIYGNPLTATTHASLILECIEKNIDYKIIHNASVFDAVAETGLQLYKFGKVASIPMWNENYKPDSFAAVVKENLSIDAHTLILVDIGLSCWDALNQLEDALQKKNLEIDYIYICSKLGTNNKKIICIRLSDGFYEGIKRIEEPFCFVIPSKMHFIEKDFMRVLRSK